MSRDVFDEAAERWAEGQRSYAKFVARYWADERFRAEVQRDPAEAVRRAGLDLPDGQRVRIVEVADGEAVVAIPRTTRPLEPEQAQSHCFGTIASMACVGSYGGTFACGGTFGTAGSFNPCFGKEMCFGASYSCWPPFTTDSPAPDPGDTESDTGDTGDTGELKSPR